MTRDINRDMADYLPRYYEDAPIVTNITGREAAEFTDMNADIYDVLAQFYIDTATWGMARWENIFGVTVDEAKPIEQRRSVIKGKLRGIGTVNAALIEQVAEAYDNGTVTVEENNAAYTIIVTFVSNRGVPVNLDDIQAALRDIIPAHLAISFEFTYLTWDELDAQLWTWNALDALALTWDQLEIYQP